MAGDGDVRKFIHPGAGRGRGRTEPRGRQVEERALEEVSSLLGDAPRSRDMLIEHLHVLQDRFGALTARHLVALAHLMRLSLAEVYEVATFYAHFDVLADPDAEPPHTVTVRVCDSLPCMMAGADTLLAALEARTPPGARIVRAPCMGRCDRGPAVEVGHRHIDRAVPEAVAAFIASGDTHPAVPDYPELETARGGGAYRILAECRTGKRTVDTVKATLAEADLRGMGGAGFPAARKWDFVLAAPGPRALVVNADEGEPGTFKDRLFLESEPHVFLEGMLIAAWAIEAETTWIYLRDEYPAAYEILSREIAALEAEGIVTPGFIRLRRGAGAYICGEESALIESIEGKRGLPRHRPPYVAQVGVFGRPTLVHNVETLYWVRTVLATGAAWYRDSGRRGHAGLRAYSVSGRVARPGVKVAPNGITLRELIDEHCGGMAEGHELKAWLPGGASGGILPADKADLPLAFGSLEDYGCFTGSGAVVVLSQHDDVRAAALNLMRFFEAESCGQCTPCRVGTEKAVALMSAPAWDTALLGELSQAMRDASICGLGQAAPNPMDSVIRWFPDEA